MLSAQAGPGGYMGTFIPHMHESYLFAKPNGNVAGYSWAGDDIDTLVSRTVGVWRPEEEETVKLQSMVLAAVSPSGTYHWSDLDYKAFWRWVDGYELHT